MLFVTITANGWLEIVAHVLRKNLGHRDREAVLATFTIVWIALNVIIFLYFQLSHYVFPYRRLLMAERDLDQGARTITNMDPHFEYTVHGKDKARELLTTHSSGSMRRSMLVGSTRCATSSGSIPDEAGRTRKEPRMLSGNPQQVIPSK